MSHHTIARRSGGTKAFSWRVSAVLLGWAAWAGAEPRPCTPTEEPVVAGPTDPTPDVTEFPLYLYPIPGLTTVKHEAPASFAVPLGTQVRFFQAACPDDDVQWEGAVAGPRNETGTFGFRAADSAGTHDIRVTVTKPDGAWWETTCRVQVLDVPLDEVSVRGAAPVKAGFPVTEQASNEETMAYYFGESIATVRHVGPGTYRTSVDRGVVFRLGKVRPSAMAALMEWRAEGEVIGLGPTVRHSFSTPASHVVTVGPVDNEAKVTVETYRVHIVSHAEGDFIMPHNGPVTYIAVTDPPGFEHEITWISSTMYGTGTPIGGRGSAFTVTFDNTIGLSESGPFEWLGVKADNAVVGQDRFLPYPSEPAGSGGGSEVLTATNCRSCDGATCINVNFGVVAGTTFCPGGIVACWNTKVPCQRSLLLGAVSPETVYDHSYVISGRAIYANLGDQPAAGFIVEIALPDRTVLTTTTDAEGYYQIEVPANGSGKPNASDLIRLVRDLKVGSEATHAELIMIPSSLAEFWEINE